MTIRRFLVLSCLAAASASLRAQAADAEGKLIGVLRSDAKLFDKAKACQRLAAVGTKRAVPALAALLGHEQLGGYARFGLEPIADPSVDDALRAALGKLEGRLRIGVINSIGVRRDPKAVPALVRLALGGSREAVWALGQIATDEAVTALRQALGSELRAQAAHACLVAAERRGGSVAGELCDAVRKAKVPAHVRAAATYQRMKAPGGVRLLVEQLRGDDAGMRAMALRAAREAAGDEMTKELVAQVPLASPAIQMALVQVIVDRGDRAAATAIAPLVESAEQSVRLAAIGALGELGGRESIPVLLGVAAKGRTEERAAMKSLRAMKGDGVDAALVKAIPTCEKGVRPEFLLVLRDRRVAGAADALLVEAASKDQWIMAAAGFALCDLGRAEDIPELLKLRFALAGKPSLGDVFERAIGAIAKRTLPEEARTDGFLEVLARTEEPEERAAIFFILGHLGGEKAYKAVAPGLDDPNPMVTLAAVRALANWPDQHAGPALLKLLRSAETRPNHRALAFVGYMGLLRRAGEADPRKAAADVAEAMGLATNATERRECLSRVAGVPHPDALALAVKLLDDPEVRDEAAMAAVKVAGTIAGTHRDAARAAMEKVRKTTKTAHIVAEAKKVLAAIDRFGDAITAWRIAGPYSQEGKRYSELFDIVFEPEKPDAKGVVWRMLPAGTDPKRPQILDLLKAIGGAQRVAYALTWVHSGKAQPARLELGSDDGVKAWLNGRLVHANNAARAAKPYTDKVNVALKAGWNPLMLKITQNDSPWEFCGRLCGRDGKPLRTIRFDPAHTGSVK